ncbi:MAG: hypothetical protein ACOZAP_04615 [Pseudomonadota bacterium]
MATQPLTDADKARLADTARRYAQARGMPLPLARQIVWQAVQTKGLEIACSLAPADAAAKPAPRSLPQAARAAFEQIGRKLGRRTAAAADLAPSPLRGEGWGEGGDACANPQKGDA